VTISVRVPRSSLELLERVVDGEHEYLRQRRLPTRSVTKSAAFRTIWELGEVEYFLQRATLWVTRKTNRYTLDRAAELLRWNPEALRELLEERGVEVARDDEDAPPGADEPPRRDPRPTG
jgi:hypothetical protein